MAVACPSASAAADEFPVADTSVSAHVWVEVEPSLAMASAHEIPTALALPPLLCALALDDALALVLVAPPEPELPIPLEIGEYPYPLLYPYPNDAGVILAIVIIMFGQLVMKLPFTVNVQIFPFDTWIVIFLSGICSCCSTSIVPSNITMSSVGEYIVLSVCSPNDIAAAKFGKRYNAITINVTATLNAFFDFFNLIAPQYRT